MNQWMTPTGGPEVAAVPLFAMSAVTAVRYETAAADEEFSVVVIPTRTAQGAAIFRYLRERCTFMVRLLDGRYEWRQQLESSSCRISLPAGWKARCWNAYRFPRQGCFCNMPTHCR